MPNLQSIHLLAAFHTVGLVLIPEILSPLDVLDIILLWLFSSLTWVSVLFCSGGFPPAWVLACPRPLRSDLFSSPLTLFLLSVTFVALHIHTLMTPEIYMWVPASPLDSYFIQFPIGYLISISNLIWLKQAHWYPHAGSSVLSISGIWPFIHCFSWSIWIFLFSFFFTIHIQNLSTSCLFLQNIP